jgi:signal transduction histidine kinase
VRVRIRVEEGELLVVVTDDGAGFDTAGRTAGFGLAGMRERVYLAGGSLELESAKGRGTTVSARLPARNAGKAARPLSIANQAAS